MITKEDLRNFVMTASMIEERYLDEYLETQAYRLNDKVLKTFCQDITIDALNNKDDEDEKRNAHKIR